MLGAIAVRKPEAAPVGTAGLEAVFREHHQRVFRAAYRITGNAHDAEDVLQTVFLRLAHQGETAQAMANPASYLYRAGVNAALDVLRQRGDRRDVPLDDADAREWRRESPPTPEQVHEAAEIRAWLREALARLEPRQAEIFALRYLEGMGNVDIARMLDISRVTVAVSLYRARHRLQKQLRTFGRGRS